MAHSELSGEKDTDILKGHVHHISQQGSKMAKALFFYSRKASLGATILDYFSAALLELSTVTMGLVHWATVLHLGCSIASECPENL